MSQTAPINPLVRLKESIAALEKQFERGEVGEVLEPVDKLFAGLAPDLVWSPPSVAKLWPKLTDAQRDYFEFRQWLRINNGTWEQSTGSLAKLFTQAKEPEEWQRRDFQTPLPRASHGAPAVPAQYLALIKLGDGHFRFDDLAWGEIASSCTNTQGEWLVHAPLADKSHVLSMIFALRNGEVILRLAGEVALHDLPPDLLSALSRHLAEPRLSAYLERLRYPQERALNLSTLRSAVEKAVARSTEKYIEQPRELLAAFLRDGGAGVGELPQQDINSLAALAQGRLPRPAFLDGVTSSSGLALALGPLLDTLHNDNNSAGDVFGRLDALVADIPEHMVLTPAGIARVAERLNLDDAAAAHLVFCMWQRSHDFTQVLLDGAKPSKMLAQAGAKYGPRLPGWFNSDGFLVRSDTSPGVDGDLASPAIARFSAYSSSVTMRVHTKTWDTTLNFWPGTDDAFTCSNKSERYSDAPSSLLRVVREGLASAILEHRRSFLGHVHPQFETLDQGLDTMRRHFESVSGELEHRAKPQEPYDRQFEEILAKHSQRGLDIPHELVAATAKG